MKTIDWDDYYNSSLCEETYPDTPLSCCGDKGHMGNHIAYGKRDFWLLIRRKQLRLAEWTQNGKTIYLAKTWQEHIKLKKEFERR